MLAQDRLHSPFEDEAGASQTLSLCLHMVMDNHGTHVSVAVLVWAKTHNVRLCFTPTNAWWLNRIECHFGPLKKFALNNSNHRSRAEQQAAIMS